ncbi:hypothetical protein MNBD_GAMMA01-551 [hydrothermal vent metagenome]|uniref:ATPase n=1 Tax=hydrothermal vent metagenome TaxID=652676 RepID=A0A3B0VHY4_9ZZZZ
MIIREITQELKQLAQNYPIVTIIGPRQSGKTTLAKMTFPDYLYCSLEDPDLRKFAQDDPRSFLNKYHKNTIFDEIQRVPELLSYLQTVVDAANIKGRFILTGSHQLQLRAEISQSLAGRTALLTLLPLSISEAMTAQKLESRDVLLYQGLFPRIYKDNLQPTKFYANYYSTYIERDVRQLINLKNATNFEKFLKLLAGRVGQLINFNSLSNDVGVTAVTLKEWLSVLEASFIIFKLEPYFENFGKRAIKSPKIYFNDTGLLAYLLDIDSEKIIGRDPLIGNIFENLVILELMKSRLNRGLNPNIYFFRDSNGLEVDVLYKKASQLIPIEIKSAATFTKAFAKSIHKFQKLTKKAQKGYVVYAGDFTADTATYTIVNYLDTNGLIVN